MRPGKDFWGCLLINNYEKQGVEWRPFIEDFRIFCLTAPDILALSPSLT